MGDSTFGKFRTKANLLSVPFSIIVGFIIWLILGIYYKIEMGWEVLLLICVYLFPYLSYSVDMYFLIKHDRMLILAKCFALAMIPNLILALYLLPNWGWIGGLISATISQMILWRLIRYETNKVQNKLLNI
jgi:O-antigen/teichoic acid export membrane protein